MRAKVDEIAAELDRFARYILDQGLNVHQGTLKGIPEWGSGGWGSSGWPPVDVIETISELLVFVDIPGLRQASDIKVELKGNVLILEGEAGHDIQSESGVKIHQHETRRGRFKRTVTLPIPARVVQAAYQRGILEIRLAKTQGAQAEALKVEFLR
ncbi:MAG: Hsp20/alpha crystallin family protein [Ignavibacteriales bacterium]